MSSKASAQRSSPPKRSDNRQRQQPIQRQSLMGGSAPNPAEMQKRLGNQGTQAWLAGQQVQAKLTIGQPGDQYEQEADSTADAVMRMPEPAASSGDEESKRQAKSQSSLLQRSNITPIAENRPMQRLCTECEKEFGGQSKENLLQRKENNKEVVGLEKRKSNTYLDLQSKPVSEVSEYPTEEESVMAKSVSGQLQASSDLQQKLNNSKGSGRALPKDTRSSLESAIGADFSNVNIHTGTDAVEMNKELGAQAFTHGSDIYFNQGRYDPSSRSGKHLLAHELTHTVQQGGSSLHTKKQSGEPEGGSFKTEAPNIQAFGIPFTDYETDFSIEGVKNAANIAKDAVVDSAGWVKDKVAEGMEWVFDQISDLVNAGIDWLTNKFNDIKEFATSSFESIKNALENALAGITSPMALINNAFSNMDANALSIAWNALSTGANAVWQTVKVVVDGVLAVGSGIWNTVSGYVTSLFDTVGSLLNSEVFQLLPNSLQSAARSLFNTIRSLWESIRDFWDDFWKRLTSFIQDILASIESFVQRIISYAIDPLIDMIGKLGRLVRVIEQAVQDPDAAMKPLVDGIAGKVQAEMPDKAIATGTERLQEATGTQAGLALTPATPTTLIQRQPSSSTPAQKIEEVAPVERTTASGPDIWEGFVVNIKHKWAQIHLWQMVKDMLWSLVWPWPAIGEELSLLWNTDLKYAVNSLFNPSNLFRDPLGFFHDLWTDILHLLDIPLAILRRLNNILMLLMGWITLALVIIGAIGGTFAGAVIGGILAALASVGIATGAGGAAGGAAGGFAGAGAGFGAALAIGEALFFAFLMLQGTTVAKTIVTLLTGRQKDDEKKRDYGVLADSLIGLGVALILAIAGWLASKLASFILDALARIPALRGPVAKFRSGLRSTRGPRPPENQPANPQGTKYGAASDAHVKSHGHAPEGPPALDAAATKKAGTQVFKSKFAFGEGGQAFTDEVMAKATPQVQSNGRIKYEVPDLGRVTGTGRNLEPVRGGTVIVEGPKPHPKSSTPPNEVVTQFPSGTPAGPTPPRTVPILPVIDDQENEE